MNLETYLISKKIDSTAFRKAEPDLWQAWSYEFEQMHPNSFTVQKLNLINPIRRKYPLPITAEKPQDTPVASDASPTAKEPEAKPAPTSASPKPSIPKPVFKPKPKMS